MVTGQKARVCIVEPAHSHEEVIFPLVELLRESFEVFVIAPQSLLEVDLLKETSHLYHQRPFGARTANGGVARILGRLNKYRAIQGLVADIDPNVLIFNSTYRLPDVAIIAHLFRKYRKIQIIHNFQYFLRPLGPRLYHAFDGNFVISEQVHHYVTTHYPVFSDLEYFLPIFFEQFCKTSASSGPENQRLGPHVLRLGVVGNVDQRRRNYTGLLNALTKLDLSRATMMFNVALVGSTPERVEEIIRGHYLQGIVDYYPEFVPFREMFHLVNEMDVLLFLIDRAVEHGSHYNRHKITGTSTLMKAFHKVGVASTDFFVDESLKEMCYYYDGTNIGDFLKRIVDGEIMVEDIRSKARVYMKREEFSFPRQKGRLVSFIQRLISQ